MNYLVYDTKKASYRCCTSREKVEEFTDGNIKKTFLTNIFTYDRKSRSVKKSYTDDRYIILPFSDRNITYTDKYILHKIMSFR